MSKPETEIALGIVVDQGKVLVIERLQREVGRDGKEIVWAFPGGKIEAGENSHEAAIREVDEETGYAVEALEIIAAENHAQYPVFVHYVGCRLLNHLASPHEIPATVTAKRWVPADAIEVLFGRHINEKVSAYIQEQAFLLEESD